MPTGEHSPGRVTWRRQRETTSRQRRSAIPVSRKMRHSHHTSARTQPTQRTLCAMRKTESATPRTIQNEHCDFVCSSARRRRTKAQEEKRSPPDPATTSTATRSAAAQQCSAKRLTRHTVGADTTQDGLSQRRRSYGSDRNDPRREVRDESAVVQTDDEDASKGMSVSTCQRREPRDASRDESEE